MGGLVRGRLLIWGDAMCLRARIRSFKPPQLHFLPFYHNLEVDKDCLVTQFCLFCIVTSLKILASYTLLPLLMYSCKFQLRNSIFIILYTITCALNDQSCRCAIKQHSFIHSLISQSKNENKCRYRNSPKYSDGKKYFFLLCLKTKGNYFHTV